MLAILVFGLVMIATPRTTAQKIPSPLLQSSTLKLRQALANHCNILQSEITLRQALERLASTQPDLIIWLDRRVDGEQLVSVKSTNSPLSELLAKTLETSQTSQAWIDTAIVIAPNEMGSVVEAAYWRLFQQSPRLARQSPLQWNFATPPSSILDAWCKNHRLTCTNLDVLPYDLWNAGDLSDLAPIAQLALLTSGFGLTADFADNGREFLLVPIDGGDIVSGDYLVNRIDRENAKTWKERWPGARTERLSESEYRITASVAAHHELLPSLPPLQTVQALPKIEAIRLTLTVNAQVGPLIENLRTQLDLEISPWPVDAELARRTVQFEIQEAPIDEFLKVLAENAKCQISRKGRSLKIE